MWPKVWNAWSAQKILSSPFSNTCFLSWTGSVKKGVLDVVNLKSVKRWLFVEFNTTAFLPSSFPPTWLSSFHLLFLPVFPSPPSLSPNFSFSILFFSIRYYFKFSNNLCQQVWPSHLWSKINLHPLRHHLVHHWSNRCPAVWPPVCLQRHSGESL